MEESTNYIGWKWACQTDFLSHLHWLWLGPWNACLAQCWVSTVKGFHSHQYTKCQRKKFPQGFHNKPKIKRISNTLDTGKKKRDKNEYREAMRTLVVSCSYPQFHPQNRE